MDSKELVAAFQKLDRELASSCEIVLVGGAAMILNYGACWHIPFRPGVKDSLFLGGTRLGRELDTLFQEWHRLKGNVLLQKVDNTLLLRPPEQVIASSTKYCRESSRLMWILLGWLVTHVDEIDASKLLDATRANGDLSVLGLVCDAAHIKNPNLKFAEIMAQCAKHVRMEPFFRRVANNKLALESVRQNPLDVFLRWNYLSNELSYG